MTAIAILLRHRQAREIAKTQRPCSMVEGAVVGGRIRHAQSLQKPSCCAQLPLGVPILMKQDVEQVVELRDSAERNSCGRGSQRGHSVRVPRLRHLQRFRLADTPMQS